MNDDEALALYRKWYGTAEIRKPPEDWQLKKYLGVDRATWESAVYLVSQQRRRAERQSVVKLCRRMVLDD